MIVDISNVLQAVRSVGLCAPIYLKRSLRFRHPNGDVVVSHLDGGAGVEVQWNGIHHNRFFLDERRLGVFPAKDCDAKNEVSIVREMRSKDSPVLMAWIQTVNVDDSIVGW